MNGELMKKKRWIIWVTLSLSYLFTLYCGEPTTSQCQKDSDCHKGQICSDGKCSDTSATEKKADEKSGKSENSVLDEPPPEGTPTDGGKTIHPDETADSPPSSEESTAHDNRSEALLDEPSQTERTNTSEESFTSEEDGTPHEEPASENPTEQPPEKCNSQSIRWRGSCVSPEQFCTTKFSQQELAHMEKPYSVVFDQKGNPFFCKTKAGSYYLPGQGYRFCDRDGDGWLNIEAYRAVTSTDKAIRYNARCDLRKIDVIVYHPDNPNSKPQIQFLQSSIPLIETSRNDGGEKTIELPVYPDDNAPLPKGQSTACQSDADCQASSVEVCYFGFCVKGRRFKPEELNTFTKACVKNIDLNHNLLDDPTEQPNDSPKPPEFAPLLKFGYFVELNYGYYQKDYSIGARKFPVYHIFERSREKSPDKGGLALLCGEDPKGEKPDYWKRCYLKDDQRCKTSGGNIKRGLSRCWMDKVKHATRSLFKCAVFNGQKDASTYFFHPNNFGLEKKYSRTVCRLKGSLIGRAKDRRDVKFECKIEKSPPNLSQNEVGWACVSFHSYKTPDEYLAGCIDECTESQNLPGAAKPCGVNNVCTRIPGSYGRGKFKCDSGGTGGCRYNLNYCDRGKWTNCPKRAPSTEKCNGIDDDCDGKIDEDPNDPNKRMRQICYTAEPNGCKKNSNGTFSCTSPCRTGIQVCYMGNWGQCYNEVTPAKEKCDGKDNDCDGKVDEDWPVNQSCYAGNIHCRERGVYRCKNDSKVYCTAKNRATTETCNGKDDDCDGRIDEVCPKDITISAVVTSPSSSPLGNTVDIGTVKSEACGNTDCPEGTVLIGIEAATSGGVNWIRSIKYTCAEIKIIPLNDGGKIKYQAKFGKKFTYECSANSYSGGTYRKAECPEGYVVVGFSGSTGSNVDNLKIRCRQLEITTAVNKLQLQLSNNVVEKGPVGGPNDGPNKFTGKDCPFVGAVTGLKITYHDLDHSEISGFSATCKKLSVEQKEVGNNTSDYNRTCRKAKCPDGSVMVGLEAENVLRPFALPIINALKPICATIRFRERGGLYFLNFTETTGGGCSPGITSKKTKCPQGHVLVGFSGRTGANIDKLTIWCSEVKLNWKNGKYQLALQPPQKYGTLGVSNGGNPFLLRQCQANTALTELLVSYDQNSNITGFTYICHQLGIKYKP